jgi:UV DNA damage endonuclease
LNFGLCCLFHREKIKFKTFTLKRLKDISTVESVYSHNIASLQEAFDYCHNNSIASYRVSSDIFPSFALLLREGFITEAFLQNYLNRLSELNSYDLKLSFHPSQFVNPSSPNPEVVKNSFEDLNAHAKLSKYLGISEINIHLGGRYGDKEASKERFIERLRDYEFLNFITLENDELNYSIVDTVEVAKELGVRVVYDIHHQRCYELKESLNLDEEESFKLARETWKGFDYQRVHLSNPRDGYTTASKSRPHSDYISDFPQWLKKYPDVHIDIEAKAKESAIERLARELC